MPDDDTKVIQVSNLSPTVSKDQMKTLFGFIGKIDEIQLYPEELADVLSRVCFVKFRDSEDVGVSLHLTNTLFVDRPMIIVAVHDGKIPEESTALGLINNPSGVDPGTMHMGLTQYPALPASTELSKVEEIRRTVYVSNIDSVVAPEVLIQFFGQVGEVKYVRMAGDETFVTRSAFVEYTDQVSVVKALSLNGQLFAGRPVKVTPSNYAIVKTVAPGLNATSREIEEAMRKVNEAQPLIAAAVDPDANGRRTRSKSRSSRHKSSRSHRSRSRRRSRSKSRRSRSRRRSSSRSCRGSQSGRHSRSRSRRSRTPKRRRSRSKSREKDRRRHRSKSRSPRPSKSRKSRSNSRSKRRRSRSGSKGKVRDGATKKSGSRSHSPSIPKLERENSSISVRENKEIAAKKKKTEQEEKSSKRESSRRKSRSPKRLPKKSKSRSKSPKESSKKDKAQNSNRDGERKGSDRDKDREKDRDAKRDHDRESRRKKDRSPEKKREGDRERDSKKDQEHGRERNCSRERRTAGDTKSSRHRDRDQAEEKPRKVVKRDYDEEEKNFDRGGSEEKVKRPSESDEQQSGRKELRPSGRKGHDSAPVDANLTRMDMDVDSE